MFLSCKSKEVLLEFTKLLSSLLSYWAIYTFPEVEANERGKDNGMAEKMTSEQRTEINFLKMGALLSAYPATAVGGGGT